MYDFDSIIDRRSTDSFKWDVGENELPMWVADMDFAAAPEIVEAFFERLKHGIFGYCKLNDEWYDAYTEWWKRRHGLEMDRDGLIFASGVVPAILSVVKHLTSPGDRIIMLTPMYNHFYSCISENGRRIEEVELVYNGEGYSIDFDKLEAAMKDSDSHLMIFCNPQNPTGTIWSREEIYRIGELCRRYDITVISDEIHCDIITPGREYVPFASVSENCRDISITCIAPTKAFNLAGLQSAALYVYQEELRKRVSFAVQRDELSMPNTFASAAAVAAFTNGEAWLSELNEYIYENKKAVNEYLNNELSGIKAVKGDAAYLMWLDCTALDIGSRKLSKMIREKSGLYLMSGSHYGKGGNGFLRMNVACPRALLYDGLDRLKAAVGSL